MNSINGRTTEVGMAACALTMLVLFILTTGAAVPLQAQTESGGSWTPTVTHNTWTSGTPIPTPVFYQAMGVLGGQIYVVGGGVTYTTYTADTQIYNPATNAWSTGTPLPTPTIAAAGAVVKNVLYVMGGYTTAATDAVWAYSTKTKTWTPKASMPTALYGAAVVVEKNIIYLMGGQANDGTILNTVESYNPATNAWSTSEAPMLVAKTQFTAGLVGTTIVAPDGVTPPTTLSGTTKATTLPRMCGRPSRPIPRPDPDPAPGPLVPHCTSRVETSQGAGPLN